MNIVVSLANAVGSTMRKEDIKDVHRALAKKDGKLNTPIIVETVSTVSRDNLLASCKNHNIKNRDTLKARHLGLTSSTSEPIYVCEQLTAKASRLLFLGRDAVKTTEGRCWSSYGRIYIKKDNSSTRVLLHSEAQIQDFINNQ
ncbi:hypothetical protein O0L34_g19378 [Tuta absoluta]|nr:hypothetical protein O0L34_g19378 [Tuta absoluta]